MQTRVPTETNSYQVKGLLFAIPSSSPEYWSHQVTTGEQTSV